MKNEILSWALAITFLCALFGIFYFIKSYPYISISIGGGFALYGIKILIKRDFLND
jgi:hypothetical protein